MSKPALACLIVLSLGVLVFLALAALQFLGALSDLFMLVLNVATTF